MVEIGVFLLGVIVGLVLGLALARTRRTDTLDASTLGAKLFLGRSSPRPPRTPGEVEVRYPEPADTDDRTAPRS